MSDLNNPHDKIFKQIEKDPMIARDLIQGLCPKNVVALLDLSTLKNDVNSYIDETLKEYYSDLAFDCESSVAGIVKVSILLEHKSYKPENEFLQLLRYMLNIWEFQSKNKEPLKPVIPIILYHGEKEWKTGRFKGKFPDLGPVLKRFLPDFSYIMADLSTYTEEQLQNQIFLNSANRLLTLLFKHFNDQDYLEDKAGELFTLIKDYINDSGKDIFISLFLYYTRIADGDAEQIAKKIEEISKEGGSIAMTAYNQILNKGIEEGIQKGIQQGVEKGIQQEKLQTAKNLQIKGIPLDVIHDVTGLSVTEIQNLK